MQVSTRGTRIVIAIMLSVCACGGGRAWAEDNPTPVVKRITPRPLTEEEEEILKTVVLDTSAEPSDGPIPLTVHFSAEPLGDVVPVDPKYVWNFGDHSKEVRGQKVTHTYKKAGDYKVTVTVTARGDMTGSDWVYVTANPPEKTK